MENNINILKLIKPNNRLDLRSPTAYNIVEFIRYFNIDVDVLLSNGEPLQRPHVWNLQQKQDFILAILREIIIPPIYIVMLPENDIIRVIDGKQRITALMEFVENKYPITIDNVDYFYNQFDKLSQCKISSSFTFDTVIHYEYNNNPLTDKDLIDYFELVNFKGTPQEVEHMNKLKSYI